MKFLMGKTPEIAAWAAKQLPWASGPEFFNPCEAWGIMKDDQLFGAVVFNNYRPDIGDIELNVISPDGHWGGRDLFAAIGDYLFNQLGCTRISVTLPKGAAKNRAAAVKAGFILEGTRRKGFPGGGNAMMYGMLREECRWLPEKSKEAA